LNAPPVVYVPPERKLTTPRNISFLPRAAKLLKNDIQAIVGSEIVIKPEGLNGNQGNGLAEQIGTYY
jgi:hypothetical protein